MAVNTSLTQVHASGMAGKDADGNWQAVATGTDGSVVLSPLAGEENVGSSNSLMRTRRRTNPTKISTLSSVVIGSGAAADVVLHGIYIELNATAVTVTVAGFGNEAGVAKNLVFTGSTTADVHIKDLDALNIQGALTITVSVVDKATVFWSVL